MNRKSFVLGACLLLILGTAFLAVQAGAAPYVKGAWYLTPMVGGIFYLDEPNVNDNVIVGGRLGYFLNKNISLEGDFDYAWSEFKGPPPAGASDGVNANHYFYLLNALYHFQPALSERSVRSSWQGSAEPPWTATPCRKRVSRAITAPAYSTCSRTGPPSERRSDTS